jgi:Tol biopolymer transport system component
MRSGRIHRLAPLAATLLLACGAEPPTDFQRSVVGPSFSKSDGEWSTPVNLGPVVNSPATEGNPTLSADELAIYFASDRPGGLGGSDIWVTRRASRESPWEPPVNVGAPINTPSNEEGPALSQDGHLLFIHSDRPGTLGGNDIWMSRRSGNTDDDWETPVNLGPDVNTTDDEQGAVYSASDGALYFNRGSTTLQRADLYRVGVKRDGRTDGRAQPVTELNSAVNDAAPTLRADAREIFFWSPRPGGVGMADIWVSTRQSKNHPWNPPQNAGASLNSPFADRHPQLTQDAMTLYFQSTRPGGSGLADLWVSTRHASSKQ